MQGWLVKPSWKQGGKVVGIEWSREVLEVWRVLEVWKGGLPALVCHVSGVTPLLIVIAVRAFRV